MTALSLATVNRMGDGPPVRLILWDIDHTLIETGVVSRSVISSAYHLLTGDTPDPFESLGRTDLEIIRDLYRRNGSQALPDWGVCVRALELAMESHWEDFISSARLADGVRQALRSLYFEMDVVQAVATGNIRTNALRKLSTFSLHRWLSLQSSAFGSDALERSELVSIAVERATASQVRTGLRQLNAVLIGDSVGDMRAAREAGVRAVGVATGHSSREELYRAGAHEVLPDLRSLHELRSALLVDVTS